jgi:L-ascorbate metabolism protein UlaG (beta-lactamase superfamily)
MAILISCAAAGTPDLPPSVARLLKHVQWLDSPHRYGSACVRITSKKVIYVDPANLSDEQARKKADVILITHSHDDHFTLPTLEKLRKPETKIVTVRDCAQHLLAGWQGVTVVAPGEKISVEGIGIEAVPAYNLASAAHPKSAGWVGFVLTIDGVRLYHSGDTSLTPEVAALRGIDIAILAVRNPYMMSQEEIVQAASVMQPKVVIPVEWLPSESEEIVYIREHMPVGVQFKVLPRS